MPRGKKNEDEIEKEVVQPVEEQPVEPVEDDVQMNDATVTTDEADEALKDSVTVEGEEQTPAQLDEVVEPQEEKSEDGAKVESQDDTPAEETTEKDSPKLTMMKGSFKVYRGRNLATITAIAAAVVPAGEVIVENDVKWLPVIFTAKSGRVSKGFIVVR